MGHTDSHDIEWIGTKSGVDFGIDHTASEREERPVVVIGDLHRQPWWLSASECHEIADTVRSVHDDESEDN